DAADLPVPGGRVLALRPRQRHAERGGRTDPGRKSSDRPALSQPQPLQVGQPETAHRPGHVPQCVRPRIAVGPLVGTRPDAEPVEHDDGRALHRYKRGRRGPSPAKSSCCTIPLQAANWSSVVACPSAAPTRGTTQPTPATAPPTSTIVRSMVTSPITGQRTPCTSTVASPLRPSERRRPSA